MRIYITGRITGDKDYREKFRKAEERILASGHEPINPACLRLPESCTWDDYMVLAMDMLRMADAVYVLPDWQQSAGSGIEYGYALKKGMVILTEPWEGGKK